MSLDWVDGMSFGVLLLMCGVINNRVGGGNVLWDAGDVFGCEVELVIRDGGVVGGDVGGIVGGGSSGGVVGRVVWWMVVELLNLPSDFWRDTMSFLMLSLKTGTEVSGGGSGSGNGGVVGCSSSVVGGGGGVSGSALCGGGSGGSVIGLVVLVSSCWGWSLEGGVVLRGGELLLWGELDVGGILGGSGSGKVV